MVHSTHILIVLHGESFDWGHLVREGWSCKTKVLHFCSFESILWFLQHREMCLNTRGSQLSESRYVWEIKKTRKIKQKCFHCRGIRHEKAPGELACLNKLNATHNWSCNTCSQQHVSQLALAGLYYPSPLVYTCLCTCFCKITEMLLLCIYAMSSR